MVVAPMTEPLLPKQKTRVAIQLSAAFIWTYFEELFEEKKRDQAH